MKVKDIDKLREKLDNDKREAFSKFQVWLMLSEHNTEVPTIDVMSDWIPVSERLPEDRKEKLVYLSSNRITIAKYSSRIIPLAPYKSMGWGYEPRYHFIDFKTEEVIAWMPLPVEPYKLESEERE